MPPSPSQTDTEPPNVAVSEWPNEARRRRAIGQRRLQHAGALLIDDEGFAHPCPLDVEHAPRFVTRPAPVCGYQERYIRTEVMTVSRQVVYVLHEIVEAPRA
jgi:hypothetical protein